MSSTVRVQLATATDRSYDILIGTSLRGAARAIAVSPGHTLIISDRTVASLYGELLRKELKKSGGSATLFTVPPGERSKSRAVKDMLEDKLLRLGAGRDALIVALGGGVIGDLAGFIAATFQRGIPYVQIPTTLLAQVDSSIGGKVAVNHPLGKNLIGAFYQPRAVFIDVKTLRTLPDREFANGMAEVVKYAAILDEKFFSWLEHNISRINRRETAPLIHVITRCCELKKCIVEQDETETGIRRILNFGHTIGHAVEVLQNYRIPHGEAVAMGMIAETQMSVALGMLDGCSVARLALLLHAFHLPVSIPRAVSLTKLIRATLRDKKARSGTVHYTLLDRIGEARAGVQLSPADALKLLTR